MSTNKVEFESLAEFWPFYLSEHTKPQNRMLHFVGTSGALLLIITAIFKRKPILLLPAIICGYGFSWIGHFFIEKNKPAAFKYPVKSFISDLKMFTHILRGTMYKEIAKADIYVSRIE